jgi:hypothetical protein
MFISGVIWNQMQATSLESSVSEDNVVRFMDVSADKVVLEQLYFQVVNYKKVGRPALLLVGRKAY